MSGVAAESGEVTLIAGNVTMTPKDGGPAQKLQKGSKVEVGAQVTTAERARVVIMMTDASAIRITGGSTVVIAAMTDSGAAGQSKVNVNLKSGSVGALIDSSKNRQIDFKIETPHGVATARGTYYAVVVEGGKTYTKVRNGQVSVTASPNQ
ncbi:MAG: FecR family protein [Verrucomicrobiota bacterium]